MGSVESNLIPTINITQQHWGQVLDLLGSVAEKSLYITDFE